MPSNNNFDLSPVIDSTASTPDYTRNSQGYQAGNGLDTIIKGVSDVFSMAVKGTDQFIKNSTQEEATRRVDDIRDDAINKDSIRVANLSNPDIPAELRTQAKELESMTDARQQGKLRDSHYWAKMDVIARDMRARYPGYREHIDNTISGLLGTTPANALLKSLDEEATKLAKPNDEAKFVRSFIEKNLEYLPDEAVKAGLAGDKSVWNVPQLMITAAQGQRRKANVAQATAELSLAEGTNKASKEQIQTVFDLDVHDKFSTSMSRFDPILTKIATDLSADKAGNGGINTPEAISKAQLAIAQAKEETVKEFAKLSTNPAYRLGDPAKMRASTESYLKLYDSIGESINAGTLGHTANVIKAIKENADLQAQGSDQIAADSALFRALGPTADKYLNATDNTARLSAAQDLIRRRSLTRIAGGEDAAKVAADAKRGGLPDKVIVDIYGRARELLKTGGVPDVVWQKTFQSLYGPDGNPDRLMSQGKNNADAKAIFEQWTAPSMYMAIKSKSANDPIILQNYQKWAVLGAQTVFNRELSDIRETTQQGTLVNVEWRNDRFVAVPRQEAVTTVADPNTLAAVAQAWNTGRLNGINKVISNLEPMWKEAGVDTKAQALKLLGVTMESVDTAGKDSSLQAFRGLVKGPTVPTINRLSPDQLDELLGKFNKPEFNPGDMSKYDWNMVIDIMKGIQNIPYTPGDRLSKNVQTMDQALPEVQINDGARTPENIAKIGSYAVLQPEDVGLTDPSKPVDKLKPTI